MTCHFPYRLMRLPWTISRFQIHDYHVTGLSGKVQRDRSIHSFGKGLFGYPILSSPQGILLATQDAIRKANAMVSQILSASTMAEFKNNIGLLDSLSETLCSVVDTAECLRNISPDPEWVEACHQSCAVLHNYLSQLNTHEGLYQAVCHAVNNPDVIRILSPQEKRVAQLLKYDFEKSGIHLPKQIREKFIKLNDDIVHLGQAFLEGGATNAESIVTIKDPAKAFCGIPSMERLIPKTGDSGSSTIQLAAHSTYTNVLLKYSSDEETRRQVYLAMHSGSDDQCLILDALLTRRLELANLLGYNSYREYFLQDKMAKTPGIVDSFLQRIALTNLSRVQDTVDALQQKKRALNASASPVMPWDLVFLSQYLSSTNQVSIPNVSAYFPLPAVLDGLSKLLTGLFGVRLVQKSVSPSETWHPDVLKYDIIHESDGRLGTIYMDLYERHAHESTKFDGAAHFTIQCAKRVSPSSLPITKPQYSNSDEFSSLLKRQDNEFHNDFWKPEERRKVRYQLPVVVLLMHFKKPRGSNQPALLDLNEIETLFHEMGHAMHSMLGITDFHHIAGTRVALDFVEVPSTFLELFSKSSQILSFISSHKDTREKLPVPVLEAYLSQKQRLSTLEKQDQLVMAMMDQAYHGPRPQPPESLMQSISVPRELAYLDTIPHTLQQTYHAVPYALGARSYLSFTHLASYGSSYYTYAWARIWADRLFSQFFEEALLKSEGRQDVLNDVLREPGEFVAKEVLRVAGSRDPWVGLERLGVVRDGERP